MKKLISLLILFLLAQVIEAQDLSPDFKNWYITSINLKLSKKNAISISHLTSFNTNSYRLGFRQSSIIYTRKFNKHLSSAAGYNYNTIKGSRRNTNYHRIQLALTHKVKMNHVSMQNKIQLEQFAPRLPKYMSRGIITNKWKYSNKKWPLRLSPYIKNQFFYYLGGQAITYQDEFINEEGEEEELLITQAPNGWHRYRLTLGIRARLAKQLHASLFYTFQREFNTGLAPYRELNVPSISGTRTVLPFNNYSLLGISLAYTFKFY